MEAAEPVTSHTIRERVYEQLLKEGRADVTELAIKDILGIAKALGWRSEPRLEFVGEKVWLRQPGYRASRSKPSPTPAGS